MAAAWRVPPRISLLLILAGAAWLYAPALRADFFADDYLFLDHVRGRSLWSALATPDPLSNFFRPVSRQLYFWLVAGLTHESALAFHLVNLATFLACLALLYAIGRRLAGVGTGLIAAGLVALHYAADVPVRWACGSQELLAVAGALAALLLHLRGNRRWAGAALLLAALSKEVVLLTPAIALLADRRPGERWWATARRAWPLGLAVLAWGAIWWLTPARRVQQGADVEFSLVRGSLGALLHLGQVVAGLEWPPGAFGHSPLVPPPLVPLAVVIAALWLAPLPGSRSGDPGAPPAAPAPGRRTAEESPRGPRGTPASVLRLGVAWALLASIPVAAVAPIWSAYYYLFAVCGAALALAAWLAGRPRAWTAALVILLAWSSAGARSLNVFAVDRSPWTSASHINRHYIERSNRVVRGYLASLRRAHPAFPPHSTVFFTQLQSNVAFQRADGPLLRWAYRDPTLHSYYLNAFELDRLGDGPMFFFAAEDDSLVEMGRGEEVLPAAALSMILSDRASGARDALALALRRGGAGSFGWYWMAWTEWALGDTARAGEALRRAGAEAAPGPAPEVAQAMAAVGRGDTAAATAMVRAAVARHGLDPAAHGLLADLSLIRDRSAPAALIEAYAAHVLAPRDPYAWRRWAMVQADRRRFAEALRSFDRYLALGGDAARADREAASWMRQIRRLLATSDTPAG